MDVEVERKSEEMEAKVQGIIVGHHRNRELCYNIVGRGSKLYGYNKSIFQSYFFFFGVTQIAFNFSLYYDLRCKNYNLKKIEYLCKRQLLK